MQDPKPVQHFAFGGIANPVQQPFLRGVDRRFLDARQAELDAFEQQRQAYNTALQEWQEQVYNPYVQQVQAFNEAAQRYNTEVYDPYSQAYTAYEQAVNAWNEGPRTTDYAGPAAPTLASTFDMAQPTLAREFDMQAPALPFNEEDVVKFQQEAAQRARKDAAGRAVAIDVVSDPDRFNFGSMGISNRFMAEGGSVDKDQKGAARNMLAELDAPDEDRGMQRMLQEVMDNGKMSEDEVRAAVEKVAAAGRGGDELLAYLSPESMALLKQMGGSGTINPVTGLPEFKRVSRLFKRILGRLKKPAAAAPAPAPAPEAAPAPTPEPEGPRPPTAAELMQQLEEANAAKAAAEERFRADMAAQQEAARVAQEQAVANALRADAEARARMIARPVMGAEQFAGSAAGQVSAAQPAASMATPIPGASPLAPVSLGGSVGGMPSMGGLERPQVSSTAGMGGMSGTGISQPQAPRSASGMSADQMNVSGPTAPGIGAFGPIGSVGQTGTAQEQLRMMQPQQPSASPFFAQGPASSGMVPGTISTPYNPLAMYQGPSAQGQLNYNPNLAPDMLGGFYNAGMMQDRLGNRIFAPATPVFGFAKGGEADVDAMRALVDASNMADEADGDEGPSLEDYASEAQRMLQGMGPAPGAGGTARATGVVRRMPGSGGAARPEGMGMSAESLSAQRDFAPKAAKPAKASKAAKSAKAQLKALARQYERQRGAAEDASEGLARRTLSSPTLEQPTLLEDSLTTRRFAKGGEAKKPEGESFFKQAYRRNIPVDARVYLETLLGNRTQVTEKDFTQNELSKIEEAIRRSQEYAQKNQESVQAEMRAAKDLEQRLNKGRKEGARRLTSDPEWRKAAKIWDIENPTEEQLEKQWQSWTSLFERNKDLAVGEDLISLIGEKDPKKIQEYFDARYERLIKDDRTQRLLSGQATSPDVGTGSVQYEHYQTPQGQRPVIERTLGRFNFSTLPDGTRLVTDNYDFYNEYRRKDVEDYEKMTPARRALEVLKRSARTLQPSSELANAYIGRDGRPVRIEYSPSQVLPTGLPPAAASEQPLNTSPPLPRFAEGGEARTPSLRNVMKYATETSARMFPDQQGQDDQRDAARHMLAAASVAKRYGPRAADLLGRAHEYTSNPQTFFSALKVGQPRDDLAYDLHNNRLGVQLGKRASSQEELERLVEAMARQAQYEKAPDKPWVMSPEQIEERRQRAMQPQERPQYRHGGPVHRAMTRK